MSELNPYVTSDTPLAAYFVMKGMIMIETIQDKYSSTRLAFVFVDVPERPQYEVEFMENYGGFWDYWTALKKVNAAMKEKKYGPRL